MLKAVTTNQFEKDVKLAKKRGKDLNKIYSIIRMLLNEEPLPLKHRDHNLSGNYINCRECHIEPDWLLNEEPLPLKHRDHNLSGNYINRRECHIEPDWLLIYKLEIEEIIFERTGTHSDLFK